mmetsp:Transcript_95302/g.226990  ORF Transcript_95302/g.226990 Transcript_95302/m.226990 type:complete len:313 (+) Transcript_95302:2354-3292(+)
MRTPIMSVGTLMTRPPGFLWPSLPSRDSRDLPSMSSIIFLANSTHSGGPVMCTCLSVEPSSSASLAMSMRAPLSFLRSLMVSPPRPMSMPISSWGTFSVQAFGLTWPVRSLAFSIASSMSFFALSTASWSPLMYTVRSPALAPSVSVLEISMRAPLSVESCLTTSPPRPMSMPTNSAPIVITTGFAATASEAAFAPAALEPGRAAFGTGPEEGVGKPGGGTKGNPGAPGTIGRPKGIPGIIGMPGIIISGAPGMPGIDGIMPGNGKDAVAFFSSSSGAETSLTSERGLIGSSTGASPTSAFTGAGIGAFLGS